MHTATQTKNRSNTRHTAIDSLAFEAAVATMAETGGVNADKLATVIMNRYGMVDPETMGFTTFCRMINAAR